MRVIDIKRVEMLGMLRSGVGNSTNKFGDRGVVRGGDVIHRQLVGTRKDEANNVPLCNKNVVVGKLYTFLLADET
jgi:hypothetical protein